MSLKSELALLVHDFNHFAFHIPKGKKAREAWQFWIGIYGAISFLWGLVIIFIARNII